MQIIKPLALGLCTRPIEYRKKFGLCISAVMHVPFAQGDKGVLWGEQSMWNFLAKEMTQPLIDEGVSKLKPEFLLQGFAFTQADRPNACAVRARLGGVEKTMLAFGPRYWKGQQASEPAAFEKLPLNWANAYGGPQDVNNPLGKGQALVDGVQWLAQLEMPQSRAIKPDQRIEAAGFGALDIMHPQRAQYRGTYDENYLKEHAPGYPTDLDWRYFNMAPADQWLEKLQGDEPFSFEHMHPTKAKVEGNLPGLRAKVFANYKTRDGGEKLREIPMRLTTAWFFPHAERCILISHGLAEIDTDDGSDILGLVGAVERLGQPKPDAHYLKVIEMRADPKLGAVHILRDSDLLPEGLSIVDPEFEQAKQAFAMDGLQAEAQYRRSQVDVELAREQARSMGKDPDALGIKMPVREKVPQGDELAAYVEKQMKEAEKQQWQALDDVLTQVEKALEFADKNKINLADLQHRGPPKFSAEAFLQELQKSGQLQSQDSRAIYQKLIQKEAVDKLGYLQSAHMQPPARPMPTQEAKALRAEMTIASQKKLHYFPGIDFTGADFSGLDLRKFDFSGAWLESVNFTGANLSGANLSGAVLAHANFSQAILVGAQLVAANLGRAKLKGCVLDSADLSNATLMHCSFADVQMPRANLVNAMILETTWGSMNATGVQAAGQTFYKLDMKGMILAEANLSGCNFIECDLTGVDLRGANVCGSTFITCKLDKAQMQAVLGKGAVFVKDCSLAGADLSQANFANCNFGASKMPGVRLIKAVLDGANLSDAVISQADARLASAKGALCRKMVAKDAQMAGINFQDAVLQNADLRSIDLRSSNLFGADLSRVKLNGSVQLDKALLTRARTWPRLTPEQQAALS
jgi:uncharacterized protein YjbI with pentapeptide repeats